MGFAAALAAAVIVALLLVTGGSDSAETKHTASPTPSATRPPASTVPTSRVPTSSVPPTTAPSTTTVGISVAGNELQGAEIAGGQSVELTAAGFRASSPVTITLRSTPRVLGVVDAGASGAIRLTVDIPADTAGGTHVIEASGAGADGSPRVISRTITVVDALAYTGTRHPRAYGVVALGLMLIGFVLVMLARPRRRALF